MQETEHRNMNKTGVPSSSGSHLVEKPTSVESVYSDNKHHNKDRIEM